MRGHLLSASDEDVSKVSQELTESRRRLEAGVEENRKNREVLQGLNEQIQKIRQRASEKDALIAGSRLRHHRSPGADSGRPQTNNYWPSSEFSLEASLSPANAMRTSPLYNSSPLLNRSLDVDHHSDTININIDSGLFAREREDETDREIEALINKLKAELFKNSTLEEVNEMLKAENDAALSANVNLRADVSELNRTLEYLTREYRAEQERFRVENQRYRDHVDSQHKQLISLWKAFLAVKRQMKELKTATTIDMQKQLTEFQRCSDMMRTALKHAENRTSTVQHQLTREKDDVSEVYAKFEALADRNLEVERENSEKTRRIDKLEGELRRALDEKQSLRDAIQRIGSMTELNLLSKESRRPRARSTSPESPTNGNEAMRKVRAAIHAKDIEMKDVELKNERLNGQIERLTKDLERLEKENRSRLDRERQKEDEAKRREQEISELAKQTKKAEDKLEECEAEKARLQQSIEKQQTSIAQIHRIHKEFIEDLTGRHRDELAERDARNKEDLEQLQIAEDIRANRLKDELERVQTEYDALRQRMRDLNAELVVAKKAIDDKSAEVSCLSDEIDRIRQSLAEAHSSDDEKDKTIVELRSKYDHMKEKEKKLKAELAEMTGHSEILSDENKSLQDQNSEQREQIAELGSKYEESSAKEDALNEQIEELNSTIDKQEEMIKELRAELHNAQSKAEIAADELNAQREQLAISKSFMEQRKDESSQIEREKENAVRQLEALQDELNAKNHEIAALNAKIATLDKDITDRIEQDHQVKLLISEVRQKSEQTERQLAEKNAIIEDMRDKLEDLHNDLLKQDEKNKTDIARIEQAKINDIKITSEEWTRKVRSQESELDQSRRTLNELENRCKDLAAELSEANKAKARAELELENAKQKLSDDTITLKNKIEELKEQNASEIEDLNELRVQEEDRHQSNLHEVKSELERVVAELAKVQDSESNWKRDAEDLKEALEIEKATNEDRLEDLRKLQQEISNLEQQLEQERKLGQSKIEEHEVHIAKTQTSIDEMNRRKDLLETEKERLMSTISKKSQNIAALEAQVDDLKAQLSDAQQMESNLRDDLALKHRELAELQVSLERSQEKLNGKTGRCQELEQKARDLEKEVHALRLEVEHWKEQADQASDVKVTTLNKLQAAELQLADKTAKLDSTAELLKKFEATEKNMMNELKEDNEKVSHYRRRNEELKLSNAKLSEEVTQLKTHLERKTQQSKMAMGELLDNYKQAERKAHDLQSETDQLRATLIGLQAKLERAERRQTDCEAKLEEAEKRRDELAAQANSYERSAAMGLLSSKHLPGRPGTSTTDLVHDRYSPYGSDVPLPQSISNLRSSVSSQDVSVGSHGDRAVHFNDSEPRIPNLGLMPSMDITMRYLKERIQQLESEKDKLESALRESKSAEKHNGKRLDEVTRLLDELQKKAESLENENRLLESRLNSQRQMHLSNEETVRSKEHETKTIRAKLLSAELHLREKDSKVQQLQGQLETMRSELAELKDDKRRSADENAQLQREVKQLEDLKDKVHLDKDRLGLQLDNLQLDIKTMKKHLVDLEAINEKQRLQMDDMRRNDEKRKELVDKAQAEEKHWRNAVIATKKTSEEYHRTVYEEKLSSLQYNYDKLLATHQNAQVQLEKQRNELKDAQQKLMMCNSRLRDSETSLEEELKKRKNTEKTLSTIQKLEAEWSKIEHALRDELKALKMEKMERMAEIEELKRRLSRAELEKREVDGIRARLEREVAVLRQHINALEEDKSKTEEAVKITLAERRAMDKSLAAMERENSELYRNCTQLQTQIQQLERDSGTKSVTKLLKEHAELEGRMAKTLHEKKQLELLLEQKEMNNTHKRKLLESQLGLLREQLEAERRRRLENRKTQPSQLRVIETKSYDMQQRTRSLMRPFK